MVKTIYGSPPSKSNQYRISGSRLYKSPEVRRYEKDFAAQWVNGGMVKGFFELTLIAYMKNNRADLDGIFKVILDNLQRVGAIENDCYCVKIYAEKHITELEPRVDIIIKPH